LFDSNFWTSPQRQRLFAHYRLWFIDRSGGSGVSSALEKVLSQPDARSEANEVATDNAISAVAKIVEFRPTALGNLPSFVQALLTYVPLKADLVEAKK